jgi:tRNA A37 threonylcarbamoyladenosine biosynthesis protein TsaE
LERISGRVVAGKTMLPILVVLQVSTIVSAEITSDFTACPLLSEVVARFGEITPHMLLLAGHSDLSRMHRLPTSRHFIGKTPIPDFTKHWKVGEQICIGRDALLDQVASHLRNGSFGVMLVGEPGVGKTALARAMPLRLGNSVVYEVLGQELEADASVKGVTEAKLTLLFESGEGKVFIFDELLSFYGRTGSGTADGLVARNSVADFLRVAQTRDPRFKVITTVTSDEAFLLKSRWDPGAYRRWVEVRVDPISGAALDEVVEAYAKRLNLPADPPSRRELIECAQVGLGEEKSPAREIKMLQMWANAGRSTRPVKLIRERCGELAFPSYPRLVTGLDECRKKIFGRERELDYLKESFKTALRDLVKNSGKGRRCLMTVVVCGAEGAAKTAMARTFAQSIGGEPPDEVPTDELSYYVARNRLVPGKTLIVRGAMGFSHGGVPEGEVRQGDREREDTSSLLWAINTVSRLDRWVIIIVADCDDIPPEMQKPRVYNGSSPVVWLPLQPPRLNKKQRSQLARELFQKLRDRAESLGALASKKSDNAVRRAAQQAGTPAQIEELLLNSLLGMDGHRKKTVADPGAEKAKVIQLNSFFKKPPDPVGV